jgi:hypothetical protein
MEKDLNDMSATADDMLNYVHEVYTFTALIWILNYM